ncbi:response regulator transcription factor [Roseovarius aestuariivivens]|uniref:response regulator transcription factor n=1 Tax=Roseovarius aestuariivivens TaxID=1888910 RepID=UPI001436B1F6|nr:helix-turn-helix transcriptional regulator [Roseovarius aestuariivivens]
MAQWANALNGNGDLSECLEQLLRLVRADAAMVARISLSGSQTRYIARCNRRKGEVWPVQPRAFSKELLGNWLPSAKSGSVWRLSDLARTNTDRESGCDLQIDRFAEIIAIPLGKAHEIVDVLELQYLNKPAEHDLDIVLILTGTLSSCWQSRASGLIAKTLAQRQHVKCVDAPYNSDVPLLDVENPAQLSRSEFRICTLLKEGMTVGVIAQTLSIAPATVRTHLSSVFSKTGASNQVELLHKLNRQSPIFSDVANRLSI